ncbi:hypothetical protein PHET_08642 [Paragonimus heterotremus]|uniref:Uncharacterized protein n=1 Tax=Paragonimus heterotremus TaxID=100268 RepID=A0A8J4WF78_9TREM|nr:hypothetical protein PHET_08642 [Paragonimus heterotremus]
MYSSSWHLRRHPKRYGLENFECVMSYGAMASVKVYFHHDKRRKVLYLCVHPAPTCFGVVLRFHTAWISRASRLRALACFFQNFLYRAIR